MYDQVTSSRRSPLSIFVWALAVLLALAAVVGTGWVLTRDLSGSQAQAGQSTPPAAGTPEASRVSAPADPDPSPTTDSPSASPTPTPTPAPAPPTVVALRGAASGRCLDVPGGAAVDGAALQIYDCTGAAGQQWTASASGELRTLGTMCLDDPSGGESGAPASIWTCHGGANQQWAPQADGTVRNAATGLCLDVSGVATDNATPVLVYDCHAGDNQRWSAS
ncbi:Ricin-type beta-trefoil lectin domain-containing protein [Promicromonospora umidemergens]|uniref:Ricin B lectin domain-containing protein n=1 Tax=Promicromonospora umidemergens TaxID=629679 RepID=A0ABP8XSM5_9MICO|nr:RICIN domain-containing protein [Promicromonospora umidemergens]MCP2281817.1 Ricin-type beta-trefoil lectin domain-containing protein [Promicromonospora umidemergens]